MISQANLLCKPFLILTLITMSTILSFGQDPEWTDEQLQSIYMRHLSSEGYIPNIDKDGDVQFKREGKTYYIPINAKDAEFFSIILANIYTITPENKASILEACNSITATTKVAKINIIEDRVWITVEIYVSHPEEGVKEFTRCLSAMDTALGKFVEHIKNERNKDKD